MAQSRLTAPTEALTVMGTLLFARSQRKAKRASRIGSSKVGSQRLPGLMRKVAAAP